MLNPNLKKLEKEYRIQRLYLNESLEKAKKNIPKLIEKKVLHIQCNEVNNDCECHGEHEIERVKEGV